MKKYVTIIDIAIKLGMSHSTVSRALNGHPRISAATKEKVKNLAEELGYRPNKMTANFKHGRSGLIGVIIPDLSISYFAQILEAIQKELDENNYGVLIFNTGESLVTEKEAINKCISYRVDAIVAAISMETMHFDHFEEILKHDVPLVFFDRVANFLPVPKIVIDDYQASYQANSYLIESGCKCLAHISGTINLNNSNNRLYGYLDALRDKNIDSNERLIHYYEFKPETIHDFIKEILNDFPELDGLTAFNDYVAFQAIEALENEGKTIPKDISVFGFSDEPIANYMKPKLATVEQVAPQIGQLTAEKVISILSEVETMCDEKITVKPKIIIRDSVKQL